MALYILKKKFRFEASHVLPHHDGKCARLHGHSWEGMITCQGSVIQDSGPKTGMLLDYSEIREPVSTLLESHLDHYHLNDTTGLESPTSENLAEWIFEALRDKIPHLFSVTIRETCTSECEYIPWVTRE